MKKFILWIVSICCLISWVIFADNIPDNADIQVKDPLIKWEAANLTITMMKNNQTITSYTGMIWIEITDENGNLLKEEDYTLPGAWGYEFLPEDLGSKEFQRWLEIRKEWDFYIKVSDFIDEIEYGKIPVKVISDKLNNRNYNFNILNPIQNSTIINDKLEILANIPGWNNSSISIYIDDKLIGTIFTEDNWSISYTATNISTWRHSLKLAALDPSWNILWTSEDVYFTYDPQEIELYKDININPKTWLMVGDVIDITIYTDEMAESVKIKLSDRSENDSIPLSKLWNWEFFTNTFLISSWNIDISAQISTSNNSVSKTYDKIQSIFVSEKPEITNYWFEEDEENQKVTIYWETSNDVATSFLVSYRIDWQDTQQFDPKRTDQKSFTFTDVPYDTRIHVNITPYWNERKQHWIASDTITFRIIKTEENKCGNWIIDEWEDCNSCPIDLGEKCSTTVIHYEDTPKTPRCVVKNISTYTEKIWNSYYLIWDKIENVSKYIVYSSSMPDGSDKVKVYETTDTSYEYPFDNTSEEDKFVYFWINGICDDWEELQITGATKVQVWPAENFFLLLCLTFLIYFWIKLFRQTE